MNTEEFLDILQQRGLVPESILESLRAKVQQGDRRITAKSVLKFLVKKELISRPLAKQLLNTTLTVTSNAESSILGLQWAPPPTTEGDSHSGSSSAPMPLDNIPTLSPVDSIDNESVIDDFREPSLGSEALQEEKDNFVIEADSPPLPPTSLRSTPPETFTVADVTKEKHKPKKKKKKSKKKNEWDSPLLLVGGAGLLLLLLAGVVVYYLLNRENADTILADAGDFFDGGSYTQAIKQYERFVEKFPRHPQYSTAKMQLGMARLWSATQGSSQFPQALSIAHEVLDNLKDEPAFRDAQDDLASLLPDIARGLAKQAEKSQSPEEVKRLIGLTESALSLCANTKYIPEEYRNEVVLAEIEQTLDLVRRSQEHKLLLQEALANIQQAIDNRETARAYLIHRALLHDAPELLKSEELANKLREISSAEQLVIKYIAEAKAAETSPRPSKVVAALALADRSGKPAANTHGNVAIRIGSAIYGLKAEDGTLLWVKHVGTAPSLPPLSLANGDLLIVNANHQELLRINGETGKLVWRQAFESPIAQPTIDDQRILVAESSGKLHSLNLNDGNRAGYVQFGQPILLPATVSTDSKQIYVAGEHSSLFTLSAEDFSCLGVHYLGHAKGSISVPLVTVLNKVVVAVNTGIETSRLYVLNKDENGVLGESATSQRLVGLVNTRMLSAGRRLVVLTSSGQITVSEISADSGESALTPLASRDADGDSLLARFGLFHEGHIWSAGSQLNKMAVLPTGNRLPMQNIDNSYQGDTFDHPLQIVGSSLIHVRRPAHSAGAIVAAMDIKSGKASWETHLAMPLAGTPAVDPKGLKVTTITSLGAAYQFDREALRRRVQNQATHLPASKQNLQPLTISVDLGQGRLVAGTPDSKTILHYQPKNSDGELKIIKLASPLSTSPVAWGNHFVVPTSTGQVFLYASDQGKQIGTPFQPPLVPGVKYRWLTPTIFGEGDGSRLVISDGKEKIYLLAQAATPQPHLTAEAQASVGPSPLNTRLAVVGELVCAGTDNGEVARFQLPDLTHLGPIEINAQITWGPFAVGEQVLCSTDTNELICLDKQAEVAWRQPLSHGQPTGVPVVGEASLFVAWQSGGLSRIASADGAEKSHAPLEHPVAAGPVVLGNRFIVSSPNGTLLVVDRP
ncbi:MAG: PQQ-binding-like beta-propeller repeat protein [Planctomycetes bacterium]|nr:PQQ-binding-like beta-propeller repeat protein [Planctomycetota bacterium]